MEQSASSTRHGPGRRPRVMVGLSFDPPPGLLSWARTEAVRRGADLELVHVPPPRNQQGRETYLRDPSDADWRDEHSFGRQWVEEMAAAVRPRLAEHDLRVTVTVLGGNPGPVLRRMTRRADLMVLGRRAVTSGGGGGGGGRRVGPLSVIAQVLVAPECDVLLVPEEAGLRTAERDPVPALVSAVQGAMTPGGHPVDDDVLHRLAGVQRVDGRPPLVTVPAGAVGA